jgi:hypothetical protein
MKKLGLVGFVIMVLFAFSARAGNTCDVLGLYSVIQESSIGIPLYNLDTNGFFSQTQMALVVFNPQAGTYKVKVKKVSTNVYRSVTPDFIIQTRGCFDPALYPGEAILDYKGGFGQPSYFARGSLIFP